MYGLIKPWIVNYGCKLLESEILIMPAAAIGHVTDVYSVDPAAKGIRAVKT